MTSQRHDERLWSLCFFANQESFGPADQHLPVVLVFIANETDWSVAEEENANVLVRRLRSSNAPWLLTIADSVESDRRLFPQTINDDVEHIRNANINAVVFTNRLAKAHAFEFVRMGDGREMQQRMFPCVRNSNFIRDSNPFSVPTNFSHALRLTSELFEPALHRFILLTKSHGSMTTILRPKVVLNMEEWRQDAFMRCLRHCSLSNPIAPITPTLGQDHLGDNHLGESLLGGGDPLGPDSYERCFVHEPIGITKENYIAMLHDAQARYGLRFEFAVGHSCNSRFNATQKALLDKPRWPVKCFGGSNAVGLDYQAVDLGGIFAKTGDRHDLVAAFLNEVAKGDKNHDAIKEHSPSFP